MKAICLLLICILPGYVFSQKSNSPIIGRVVYHFSHIKDTLNRNQSFKEEMALFFSTDATTYKSYDLMQNDSIANANLEDQIKNGQVKNRITLVKGTHEQIMHFFSTGEKVSLNPWGNDTILIYSKIETIKWEMIDSTKTIGGFSCKKAVGKFKGRVYEAWFCPDIAVKSGPWKLQGLPGLILEAYDTNKEVVFTFASFQNSYKQSFVSLPNNPRKISLTEFEKMKEALIQDPSGYISAMLNGQNSNTSAAQSNTSVQIQGPSSQSKKIKKINNPLELIE